MGIWKLILMGLAVCLMHEDAQAQIKRARYPRTYGTAGSQYQPPQANYQYQRQYARHSHGHGGHHGHHHGHQGSLGGSFYGGHIPYGHLSYYNYGGLGFNYGGVIGAPGYYNPFPSYTPPVPTLIYGYPPVINNYNPFNNSALRNSLIENDLRWNRPLDLTPALGGSVVQQPSTPEAKIKSVRAQAQGDMWFQQQEYHKSIKRYMTAVDEAGDRGEAHIRLAVNYVALGHLDLAVRQLKRGLAADPDLISKAEPLKNIFGAKNSIVQSSVVHRATLWAKEDIRDPDRLFLLGVLMYLQGDERAAILLETGMRLQGGGDHFRKFLLASRNAPVKGSEQAEAGDEKPSVPPEGLNRTPPASDGPDEKSNPPQKPDSDGVVPPLPAPASATPSDLSPSVLPSDSTLPSPNR